MVLQCCVVFYGKHRTSLDESRIVTNFVSKQNQNKKTNQVQTEAASRVHHLSPQHTVHC